MKKRTKFLAVVVATVMAASTILTGCGEKENTSDEKHTIGVILYGKDDAFGAAEYAYINSAAEALDVDIKWALNDYTAEAQLASAENLAAAGCEGLLFLPISDNSVELISDYCESNKIWFQMMNRDISDDTIKENTQANPYYVGTSFEANEDACDYMTQILTEDGRTQVGLGKVAAGSSLSNRNDYFTEAAKKYGATILADYTAPSDGSTQAYVTYMQNFTTSYPEMNGLLMSSASGGGGETVLNTLKSLVDPGTIKICSFDTFEGMQEGFNDGWLSCLAGCIEIQSLFDFVMLYNAVDGHPLADGYTVLYQNFIFITSSEDCENYSKYISNPEYMIYDAETIQSMTVRYNPDCTLKTLTDIMDAYTLESVVAAATE